MSCEKVEKFQKACPSFDGAVENIVKKLWKTFDNCGKV